MPFIFTPIDYWCIILVWWRRCNYIVPPNFPKKEGVLMPEEPKVSKAQQKAVNKYVKNNYDRINVTFPKGQKAEIKACAESHGESVNAFIVRVVNEAITR